MFRPCRPNSNDFQNISDDTFQSIYIPYLKTAKNFSIIKYVTLVLYCVRAMQEHLSLPIYCTTPTLNVVCEASACFWLHRIIVNLPKFLITSGIFIEQCSYLLVFFFASCSMFLYVIYLAKENPNLKVRYRLTLIMPSVFFEFLLCFLSYYSVITSIFEYTFISKTNPTYFSSAFVIFSFVLSIVYAALILIHFATVYYLMIDPLHTTRSSTDNNYSALQYRTHTYRAGMSSSSVIPLMNENYGSSQNGWNPYRPNFTNTYSQVRTIGGTLNRTVASSQTGENARSNEDNEYFELI